ncbi:unnamed protein product [Ambrosiozyma monospora]|uniref:Unnamed protein product n=1 Tax=Ambrosiozyma monospora TaxID=43982 RepID=A0ACB5SUL9_AMBMO|nr:unnamed protein product [Ambrosiozyma monospora]
MTGDATRTTAENPASSGNIPNANPNTVSSTTLPTICTSPVSTISSESVLSYTAENADTENGPRQQQQCQGNRSGLLYRTASKLVMAASTGGDFGLGRGRIRGSAMMTSDSMEISETMNRQISHLAPGAAYNEVGEERILSDLIDESDSEDSHEIEKISDVNLPIEQDDSIQKTVTVDDRASTVCGNDTDANRKYGFFDKDFKIGRLKILQRYVTGYFILISILFCIFSLFWGCYYHRNHRFRHFTFLLLQDDPKVYEGTGVPDVFSHVLLEASKDSYVSEQAGWKPHYYTEFVSDPAQLSQEMRQHIYHRHDWGAVWVKPNSSFDYYNALQSGEQFNMSDVYQLVTETGRQLLGTSMFLPNAIDGLQARILELQPTDITFPMAKTLEPQQLENALGLNFLIPVMINHMDITPAKTSQDPAMVGPLIFGPIFLHVISIAQFAYFHAFNVRMLKSLKRSHYIFFRIIFAMVTHLIASLAYTLVQVAFGIDIYSAYSGHTGFLVFWMVTFLLLCAVSGVNENCLFLIQVYASNMTPCFGFAWIAINVCAATYPLALAPKFYRFAYALPLLNAIELYTVILFNIYRGRQYWRNFVILIAYSIITSMLLPFTMRIFMKKQNEEHQAELERLKGEKKNLKQKTRAIEKKIS